MQVLVLIIIFSLAIMLQGMFFEKFALRRVEYRCGFSVNEAYEGDDVYLTETVYNRKLLPIPWLKVDIHSSRWLDFAETRSAVSQEGRRVTSCFFLRSYQRVTRRWKVKCLKRGLFRTENVTLVSGDLLGNYGVSIPMHVGAEIIVYPAIIDLDRLVYPANSMQGDVIVKRWIMEDPFIIAGAREYTSGDPMNMIHWKATAKEGKLMVRRNDFTARLSLTVMLNIQTMEDEHDAVIYRERAEYAIKAAATLIDRALRQSLPVRFATNGCTCEDRNADIFTEESTGRTHVAELFRILSMMELRNVRDFENFLGIYSDRIENSDVVVITSYLSRKICDSARLMKKQGNLVKIILLSERVDHRIDCLDIDVYLLPLKGNVYDGRN